MENAQPKSIDDPITQTFISEELPQNLKEPANPSNEAAAVVAADPVAKAMEAVEPAHCSAHPQRRPGVGDQ